MSDPRNAAHAKKVTHVKKHQGTEGSRADTAAAQSGRKPAATKKPRGSAGVASVPQVPPASGSAANGSPAPHPPTALEESMAVLAKLKEMEFYSRANLEQLAELVLTVGDQLKQKEVADPVGEVYSAQNGLQTKLTTLIEVYKAECGRLQGESV